MQTTPLRTRPVWAFLLDAVCVLVFAAGGRSSHEESLSSGGVAQTAWPFLVGLGVGWVVLLTAARRSDAAGTGAAGSGMARSGIARTGITGTGFAGTGFAATGTARSTRWSHLSPAPAGVVLVLASWGLGMGLRLVTDQGASGAFPLVALAFLTLTLIGWRAVAAVVSRRGSRRSPAPAP